jgi:hypothetical protein
MSFLRIVLECDRCRTTAPIFLMGVEIPFIELQSAAITEARNNGWAIRTPPNRGMEQICPQCKKEGWR